MLSQPVLCIQCTGIVLQTQLVITLGDSAGVRSVKEVIEQWAQLVFTRSAFCQCSECRPASKREAFGIGISQFVFLQCFECFGR